MGGKEMATQLLTEAEARKFADKLEAFGNQLSSKEQALLWEILVRASSADGDVQGHFFVNPGDAAIVAHHVPLLHVTWLHAQEHIQHIIAYVNSASVHHPGVHHAGSHSASVHHAGVHAPGSHHPGSHSPSVHTPGSHNPSVHTPGTHTPAVNEPGVNTAQVHTPSVETPAVNNPEVHTPE
jgi:hypothetical protein